MGAKGGPGRRTRRVLSGSLQPLVWIKGFAARKLTEGHGRRGKEKEREKEASHAMLAADLGSAEAGQP